MAAAIPPKISKWFDVFVSIAASVVIYGALQKLLHSPIADFMLKVGLGEKLSSSLVMGCYTSSTLPSTTMKYTFPAAPKGRKAIPHWKASIRCWKKPILTRIHSVN